MYKAAIRVVNYLMSRKKTTSAHNRKKTKNLIMALGTVAG